MRRTATTVATAAVALAAIGFAPSVSTGTTGDFDEDGTSTQGVVLQLGPVHEDIAAALDGGPWATASLDLGCGDLGGPADRAAVAEAVGALATDERSNGRVVVVGAGLPSLAALTSVVDADAPEGLAGVVAVNPVTDPHALLFSEGGVARHDGTGMPVDPLPCPHEGATDGTRDAYWADRDAAASLADRVAPVALLTDGDEAYDRGQLTGARTPLGGSTDDLLHLGARPREDGSVTADDEAITRFLSDRLDEEPTTGPFGIIRYRTSSSASQPSCVSLVCLTAVGSAGFGTFVPPPAPPQALHLNRTFEQDLDCTPVCVPGPGTGEVGTIEPTNRFEAPHAPVFTWVGATPNSERVTGADQLNWGDLNRMEELPGGHGYHSLAFHTAPVGGEDVNRVDGDVTLDGWFQTGSAGGTVTPVLVVVREAGNGTTVEDAVTVVGRAALDLDLAADRAQREHVAGWKQATIDFGHVETVLFEGDRLGVVLQSSNLDWFALGSAQPTVNVATGPVDGVTDTGSVLHVPFRQPVGDAD